MVDGRSGRVKRCVIIVDGGCEGNPGEMRVGVILSGEDEKLWYRRDCGLGTSNRAEWLALIDGLKLASALGYSEVKVLTDSELLAKQWSGEYKVRDENLKELFQIAKMLEWGLKKVAVEWVGRDKVEAAHRLAKRELKRGG